MGKDGKTNKPWEQLKAIVEISKKITETFAKKVNIDEKTANVIKSLLKSELNQLRKDGKIRKGRVEELMKLMQQTKTIKYIWISLTSPGNKVACTTTKRLQALIITRSILKFTESGLHDKETALSAVQTIMEQECEKDLYKRLFKEEHQNVFHMITSHKKGLENLAKTWSEEQKKSFNQIANKKSIKCSSSTVGDKCKGPECPYSSVHDIEFTILTPIDKHKKEITLCCFAANGHVCKIYKCTAVHNIELITTITAHPKTFCLAHLMGIQCTGERYYKHFLPICEQYTAGNCNRSTNCWGLHQTGDGTIEQWTPPLGYPLGLSKALGCKAVKQQMFEIDEKNNKKYILQNLNEKREPIKVIQLADNVTKEAISIDQYEDNSEGRRREQTTKRRAPEKGRYGEDEGEKSRKRCNNRSDNDLETQGVDQQRNRKSRGDCDRGDPNERQKESGDMTRTEQIVTEPESFYWKNIKRLKTNNNDNKQENNTDTNLTRPNKYWLKAGSRKKSYLEEAFIRNMKQVEMGSRAIELRLSTHNPKEWREDPQLVRWAIRNFMRDMKKALETKEKQDSRVIPFQVTLQAKGLVINEFVLRQTDNQDTVTNDLILRFSAAESLNPVMTIYKKGLKLEKLVFKEPTTDNKAEEELKVEVWVTKKNRAYCIGCLRTLEHKTHKSSGGIYCSETCEKISTERMEKAKGKS